jgi:hypothetical protein
MYMRGFFVRNAVLCRVRFSGRKIFCIEGVR